MRPENVTRSPLSWPIGWKRTQSGQRVPAKFNRKDQRYIKRPDGSTYAQPFTRDLTISEATDQLMAEMARLGARDVVLSTNLDLRLDGLPRSGQRAPYDPGAAVYFKLNRQDRCLACDRFLAVQDNITALARHVEAIRAIDRYGVGTIDQAFAGYAALPAPAADWRTTFGFGALSPTIDEVERKYRAMAGAAHPDRGGSDDAMARLNVAIESARAELGETVSR